jgi:hypothetical protein
MDKHIAKASIPIKEYKKSGSKQAVSSDKIQHIPFKPRPARLLDVLPGK